MRQCHCSGNCGPLSEGLSRREFLELAAAGTAGALLTASAPGATFELPPDEFEKWKRELFAPAPPRVYSSDKHTDARLHLGGIGTGNFEIGADGQLTTWQLFNTLRDGQVPFYFAIKAGKLAKLLQTTGGPDWPRVNRIEMSGEYPIATLRFFDADLPVKLELRAFSPFAPLDTSLSSTPLAAFVFKLQNPTRQAQTVSLAAFLTNPVGYDAAGRIEGTLHPNLGGNVNEPLQEGQAHGLLLRAERGAEPTLDKPVTILTMSNLRGLRSPPPDRPANLKLEVLDRPPTAQPTDPASTILWLEEAGADLAEAWLRAARDAVQAGATLVFSGQNQPLLRAFAVATSGQPLGPASARPDIVFEDFEKGYGKWTVAGSAFGKEPARGTLPNQQRVSGFVGKALVNTYLNGDDTTGTLTSQSFVLERRFIRFLIGGGSHAQTQIHLLVGGKIVRRQSGKNNERLEPVAWDVREFEGQTAHLQIVDDQQGPWGHINIDQIVFSDEPGNRAVLALLEELLPVRPVETRLESGTSQIEYRLREGSTSGLTRDQRPVISRSLGRGKVAFVNSAVLPPAQAEIVGARQQAYALLCELAGANYSAARGQPASAPGFGTVALAALAGETTVLPTFENWAEAWRQYAAEGRFTDFEQTKASAPTPAGRTRHGAVATTLIVPPGFTVEVPFVFAWHYPNKFNAGGTWMGCHYATRWADARAVMADAAANLESWRARTELFRRTFYNSTLPYWLLDCVTANAAILRHIGVVFRIGNGDCYGWEGSNGCCQPTCTHVWGYEQTLARLFPDLERDMRRIDFKHQQREDGGVNNRTDVPSPPRPTGEQPFADGHASCILKAYREALNSPDDAFLKDYWPHIQRAVEYLIARDAKTHEAQPAGYLQDDQWNTYDQALHGVTTFISGYYLAALRAGEEWAKRLGHTAAAERFHDVFEKGQRNLLELCWNGEYFQQHLPNYEKMPGEVGPGCMSDQLIGQWWAHQLGLGYILPQDKVVTALRSVFKYNFKSDLTGWKHAPRAFAGAKDKGLIICTWPKGGRPARVMLYSDEVWTGIEYQVAAHCFYEGLIEEGLAIVKAARDRYDGLPRAPIQRNPWNEIECGGHYARAMSSWSLLLGLSGFACESLTQTLRFTPRYTPDNFKCFFCAAEGWGTLQQMWEGPTGQHVQLTLASGQLGLGRLHLGPRAEPTEVRVTLNGQPIDSTFQRVPDGLTVTLNRALLARAGDTLSVRLS